MSTSSQILGMRDLLGNVQACRSPEARIKAVENALLPIIEGFGAIGALLSSHDHGIGMQGTTLADTGYLLSFMSDLASHLQYIKDDAVHEQRQATPTDEPCLEVVKAG